MSRKSLDVWIKEAMNDSSKEGPCTALSVVHMAAGNSNVTSSEVHTLKFGGTGSYEPKALADMFEGKARTYAQDLPGVQYFQIWAMYGTNEPQARLPFLVNTEAQGWGTGASESPTDTGERMQNMRQKEMSFQQVYRRQAEMDNHSIMMIRSMSTHMKELQEENRDTTRILMEVMRQKVLDDHEQRMREMAFARATEERKKWLSFAPPLINRLMGTEIFPQGMADTALIEQVADAITPEIAMKLAEVVPEQLWGPLAGRLNEAQQKQRAEREAVGRLPRANAYEGEDDVTGGSSSMVRQ